MYNSFNLDRIKKAIISLKKRKRCKKNHINNKNAKLIKRQVIYLILKLKSLIRILSEYSKKWRGIKLFNAEKK